jgi:hypothetical protein
VRRSRDGGAISPRRDAGQRLTSPSRSRGERVAAAYPLRGPHARIANAGRVVRYNACMLWLRRGWLWMIGGGLMIAGASALLMRVDLLDPEPTVSPALFSHAFALHALTSFGVLVAVVLAIPTLVVKPGRGAGVLGFLALGLWVVAIAHLVELELREWVDFSTRSVLLVLAGSLGLGAAQIVVSLPANADTASRPQLVAAGGGIAAIAIVVIPLFAGELPTIFYGRSRPPYSPAH